MSHRFVIGVDVSKHTLDVALIDLERKSDLEHTKVGNSDDGIKELFAWLKSKNIDFRVRNALVCMEATGLYCYALLQQLYKYEIDIWVENAIQIKRSSGLIRGKNDKVDAIRIAQYAMKNNDKIRLWEPTRQTVDKLKHLATLRDRLVETKKRLLTPVEEFRQVGNESMAKILERSMKKSVKGIDSNIEGIEGQIKDIIDNDDQLKRLYSLVTSVVGIGFVTAVNLIVHTNEFKKFNDVKKLACYCGIAPFEHASGTSIRGKTRVSHMANKKLKTNLHMASLSSVRNDAGIRLYYERKVAEGKSKLSVLNAIKNKLLARIIAVVKRGTPYTKDCLQPVLTLS
ncbi:MAG: IS110 family transposase [Bacteroidetes bacterium]|nr:IS110 family transposase [Bacteroidota bacterium]